MKGLFNRITSKKEYILLFTFIFTSLLVFIMMCGFVEMLIAQYYEINTAVDEAADSMVIENDKINTFADKFAFYMELNNPEKWDYAKYAEPIAEKVKVATAQYNEQYSASTISIIYTANGVLHLRTTVDIDQDVAHGFLTLSFSHDDDSQKNSEKEFEFYRVLKNNQIQTYFKDDEQWIVIDGYQFSKDHVFINLNSLVEECCSNDYAFFPCKTLSDNVSLIFKGMNTLGLGTDQDEFYLDCENYGETHLSCYGDTFLPYMFSVPSSLFRINKENFANKYSVLNDEVLPLYLKNCQYAPWTTYQFFYNNVSIEIPNELQLAQKVDNLMSIMPVEIIEEVSADVK